MDEVYRFDNAELRAAERRLLVDGRDASLGGRAFDLLLALVQGRDRVVSKAELMDRVWPGLVVEENNLTVQISGLRKVLGARSLVTVAGRGYRFALPVATDLASTVVESGGVEPDGDPSRPSIAVLPFAVHADDRALGYMADGLVEDVVAQLARVPGFFVISPRSSFEFRRRADDKADAAAKLGVRYLVEGSVRPVAGAGDAPLRATAQLVDAQTLRVLWTGSFELDRHATAQAQGEIAKALIRELQPELTRAQITLIRRRHPDNVDAWDCYHMAMGTVAAGGWNDAALTETCARLQRAIEIDPGFALAAARLALFRALGITYGLMAPFPDWKDHTAALARRALEMAGSDSQVVGIGGCALVDLGETDAGVDWLELALELDPSNAQALVAMGATQCLQGHLGTGLANMRHGVRTSPRDHGLGFWLSAIGRFELERGDAERALEDAQRAARRDRKLIIAPVVTAAAHQALGRTDEAMRALDQALVLWPQLDLPRVRRMSGERVAALVEPLLAARSPR